MGAICPSTSASSWPAQGCCRPCDLISLSVVFQYREGQPISSAEVAPHPTGEGSIFLNPILWPYLNSRPSPGHHSRPDASIVGDGRRESKIALSFSKSRFLNTLTIVPPIPFRLCAFGTLPATSNRQ